MANTIAARKLAFLESQVRLLAAPLEVPDASEWRRVTATSDGGDAEELPTAVVEKVVAHVNDRLRRHTRAAFPPAALAHVAAQIDALHEQAASKAFAKRNAAAAALDGHAARRGRLDMVNAPGVRNDNDEPNDNDNGESGLVIERGADLTLDSVIAELPDKWPTSEDEDAVDHASRTHGAPATHRAGRHRSSSPQARLQDGSREPRAGRGGTRKVTTKSSRHTLESYATEQEYAARVKALKELVVKRRAARQRLAQLRELTALLSPLQNPRETVQPNLVGREGAVGAELEKMRVLLDQAAKKVNGLS